MNTTSICPTERTSATSVNANPVNQQAEPAEDSRPTQLDPARRQRLAQLLGVAQREEGAVHQGLQRGGDEHQEQRAHEQAGRARLAWLPSLMKTAVTAKKNPAAIPLSAAGWKVPPRNWRAQTTPGERERQHAAQPIAMPTQASGRSASCSTISARIAVCAVSVLA